jgi:hypothetical protein
LAAAAVSAILPRRAYVAHLSFGCGGICRPCAPPVRHFAGISHVPEPSTFCSVRVIAPEPMAASLRNTHTRQSMEPVNPPDIGGLLTATKAPWAALVVDDDAGMRQSLRLCLEAAVNAIRRGAVDYVPKPFTPDQIRLANHRVVEAQRLRRRLAELQEELDESGEPALSVRISFAHLRQVLSARTAPRRVSSGC